MKINEVNMRTFASLFKGREDVFARRWETKDKSGYSPAYDIDWNQYSIHKASGGTLKDYPHKSYTKLTEAAIRTHVEGKEVIGVYPLLENNTSWFLAVDFDENNWRICNLPADFQGAKLRGPSARICVAHSFVASPNRRIRVCTFPK